MTDQEQAQEQCQHECRIDLSYSVCLCLKCGATCPHPEFSPAPASVPPSAEPPKLPDQAGEAVPPENPAEVPQAQVGGPKSGLLEQAARDFLKNNVSAIRVGLKVSERELALLVTFAEDQVRAERKRISERIQVWHVPEKCVEGDCWLCSLEAVLEGQ